MPNRSVLGGGVLLNYRAITQVTRGFRVSDDVRFLTTAKVINSATSLALAFGCWPARKSARSQKACRKVMVRLCDSCPCFGFGDGY